MQQPNRPQPQQPQQQRPQVGLEVLPGQESRRQASQAQPQKRGVERMQEASAAALSSMPIGDRVGAPIPIPSDAPMQQDDVQEWDPAETQPDPEPEQAPVRGKAQARRAPPVSARSKLHPIVQLLRRTFGMETIKTEDVFISKIKWTLAPLSADLNAYALRIADTLSNSMAEHAVKLEMARAACAVVAVNDEPTYEFMQVELEKTDVIDNPYEPPQRVRRSAAARLFDFLSQDLKSGLGNELAREYDERLEKQTDVTSDLKYKATYKCPKCGDEQKYVERRSEGGENEPYFCYKDGTPMEPVVTAEEAADLPLA